MISAPFDFSGTGADFAGLFGLTPPLHPSRPQAVPLAAAGRRVCVVPHGAGGHAAARHRLLAPRPGGRRRLPARPGRYRYRVAATRSTLQTGWNQIGDPFADGGAADRHHRRHRRRRHDRHGAAPGHQPGQHDALHVPAGQHQLRRRRPARSSPTSATGSTPGSRSTSPTPRRGRACRRALARRRAGNKSAVRRIQRGGETSPPRFLLSYGTKSRYNLTVMAHGVTGWLHAWAAVDWWDGLRTGADILIVAYLIYRLMMLAKGTRAWQIIWGLGVFALILGFSSWAQLHALNWILRQMFQVGAGRHRDPVPARTAPRPGGPGAARLLGQGLHRPGQRGPDHHGRPRSSAPPGRCPTARSAR